MTKDEYLKAIEQYANDMYGEDDIEKYIAPESWIPAEPETKEKLINYNGITDLTKIKKIDIPKIVKESTNLNFKIGPFYVKVMNKNYENKRKILIYEDVPTKAFGGSHVLTSKINPFKDHRLSKRDWTKYFNNYKEGLDVPEEDFINIIKWLYAIYKLPAFL